VQEKKVELIIIDYLQLMTVGSENKTAGNREQEISTISRSLKAIAKELNVPILCLSQLSRAVETRGGTSRRPQLSDLRESGAIEQDADFVMFIYRPEYYGYENEDATTSPGKTELIIAKNRKGPVKDVKIRFISHLTKFVDFEDYEFTEDVSPTMPRNLEAGRKTFESKMNNMDDDNNPDVPF
jgi:replicative DNA helicase